MLSDSRRLVLSLAILRISLVIFFLVWTLEKFLAPELTVAISESYYGFEIGVSAAYAMGAVQAGFLLLFAVGLARFWSYGFFLVTHTVSMVASYEALLNPYQPPNHLFQAGIPVLAALFLLFFCRGSDRMLVLSPRAH